MVKTSFVLFLLFVLLVPVSYGAVSNNFTIIDDNFESVDTTLWVSGLAQLSNPSMNTKYASKVWNLTGKDKSVESFTKPVTLLGYKTVWSFDMILTTNGSSTADPPSRLCINSSNTQCEIGLIFAKNNTQIDIFVNVTPGQPRNDSIGAFTITGYPVINVSIVLWNSNEVDVYFNNTLMYNKTSSLNFSGLGITLIGYSPVGRPGFEIDNLKIVSTSITYGRCEDMIYQGSRIVDGLNLFVVAVPSILLLAFVLSLTGVIVIPEFLSNYKVIIGTAVVTLTIYFVFFMGIKILEGICGV